MSLKVVWEKREKTPKLCFKSCATPACKLLLWCQIQESIAIASYFSKKLNGFSCIQLFNRKCTSDFIVSLQYFLRVVHVQKSMWQPASEFRTTDGTRLDTHHDTNKTKTSKPLAPALAKEYSIAILLVRHSLVLCFKYIISFKIFCHFYSVSGACKVWKEEKQSTILNNLYIRNAHFNSITNSCQTAMKWICRDRYRWRMIRDKF